MTKQPLLLALDQGTSSSRAALFSTSGDLIASFSSPLKIHYPADGWVEQDPEDIWFSQLKAMQGLEQQLTPDQRISVISCGITNQRETTILWRRSTGKPCSPALVWQDGRTKDICEQWKIDGLESKWRERTGLLLDPYFSASKVNWMLINNAAAREAREAKDLCFGTVESWLLWKLTGGKSHYSDMSNASRTLLMDLEELKWIDEYCEVIQMPKSALPELVPCRGEFGQIDTNLPFSGIKIQSLLGDQQAATLGQLCLKEREAKCTYGTGAFLVINSGESIHRSSSGLLSTLGWTDSNGSPTYCLEGSLFNAGTVVQWLRDELQIIENADQINSLANQVKSSEGVMVVPAFTGWGTPHWDPSARGLIIGLTRNTSRAHIAKAALEGIALSVANLVKIAEESIGEKLGELAVDGGAAASNPLMQAQANSTGLQIRRPRNLESTARGVALFAGLQAGVIKDLDELASQRDKGAEIFSAEMNEEERVLWLAKWNNAVSRSLKWHE